MSERPTPETRPCTCHPNDIVTPPCEKKFALTECRVERISRLERERDEAREALREAHDWIAEREYGEEWPTEDMFDGSQRHILNRLSALLARIDAEGKR